jgi:hypothetical protein
MKESEHMDSGEMPRDDDDRGEDLRALFEREQAHVAEQPFVNDIAGRVAAARRRRTFTTRAAQAVAVGALIAASPWLVSGSALLSTKLDALFSYAASALDSPLGYGAGLVAIIAAAVIRHRSFR